MAWSQLLDIGGGLNDCYTVVYDDSDKIYYVISNLVYEYTIIGNTQTQISNAGSFDTGAISGGTYGRLTYFKGGLYTVIKNATATTLSVWKWSGSGTVWNMVRDTGAAGAGWGGTSISDNSQIVVLASNANSQTGIINYSSDGLSWNVGSFSLSPAPYAGAYNNAQFAVLCSNAATLGIWAYWEQHNGVPPFRDAYYILQWGGTGFTTAKYYRFDVTAGPAESGDTWVKTYDFQDQRHWRALATFDHSADLNSWTVANTANPVRTHGWPTYSIGFTSPNYYTLTTGAWSNIEAIWAGAGTLKSMVRLSSNFYPYAIVYLVGTGDNYVYGKGSAVADPADAYYARFYRGVNALVEKSDLPYEGVRPGAMLTRDEDVVYIGMADASNDDPIVTGDSDDDYAAWTAYDGSVATDEPVKAIRKVQ